MDRILIATDLSARSLRAVKRGFLLASSLGSQVRLLSVVDDALPEALSQGLVADVEKELQSDASKLAKDTPCNYEVKVVAGDASEAIIREAAEFDADLIVLGVHRESVLTDTVRETTMERTVRVSHLPVLIVRNPAEDAYREVLCTVDFSPASATSATTAKRIAPSAHFSLFYAYHAPHHVRANIPVDSVPFVRQAEAECRKWCSANPAISDIGEVDLIEGPLSSVFDQQVVRHQPDLISVGAHSRPPLVRLLLGSFTRDLLREPRTDILVSDP